MREPDLGQRLARLIGRKAATAPAHVEREAHVLLGIERREQIVGLEDETDVPPANLGERLGAEALGFRTGDADVAGGRPENAAENGEKRRLARARRPHEQGQLAGIERDADALERPHHARAVAELLDDIRGFENRFAAHRANTMAGSSLVTLTMAETAEIAHIANVSTKRPMASSGVIRIGSAVCSLKCTTIIAMLMPRT